MKKTMSPHRRLWNDLYSHQRRAASATHEAERIASSHALASFAMGELVHCDLYGAGAFKMLHNAAKCLLDRADRPHPLEWRLWAYKDQKAKAAIQSASQAA
ncbi:hypothetical protein [Ferrimonas senticii]|uniref:hypothetical protein n=1 Tax=Ferrimonas senticii TaxID=394566 RepID=UPI000419E499|nr:hypothetical protein [Ferrimonas senticii]